MCGRRQCPPRLRRCRRLILEAGDTLTCQDLLCVGWGLAILGELPVDVGQRVLDLAAAKRLRSRGAVPPPPEVAEGPGSSAQELDDRAMRMALHIQLLARQSGKDLKMDEEFRTECVATWMRAMFGRPPANNARRGGRCTTCKLFSGFLFSFFCECCTRMIARANRAARWERAPLLVFPRALASEA